MRNVPPKYLPLIGLFILLVMYSLYQARAVIIGPQIWIDAPTNGSTTYQPIISIEGRAKNIARINLNDHQIFTDEKGRWSEKLIVSEGISIMTVKAWDRFGRETKKQVQIILN